MGLYDKPGFEIRKLHICVIIAVGSATNGEEELEVILRQPVSWTDQALDEGHRYKIAVTFTISACMIDSEMVLNSGLISIEHLVPQTDNRCISARR